MYNFRLGVMKSLVEKGFQVFVVAPTDEFSNKFKNYQIQFVELKNLNRKGTNPIKEILLLIELNQIYKEINPSLIFHYTIKPNIYGSLVAKSRRITNIAITTGLGYTFTHDGLVSGLVKKLYRFAFKRANEVWFLNTDDLEAFLSKKIIPATKAYLLKGEGVNTEHFVPKIKDATNKLEYKALFSSRLLWDKGIKEFAEAIGKCQEQNIEIKGLVLGFIDEDNPEGVTKNDLELWSKKGWIDFLGSTDDVRPFIADADMVILPSFYGEGVPRILLEAASMERPIITTDNVGCREVVQDGYNGYLCKKKDSEDLAIKIKQFLALSLSEKDQMGKNGRLFINEHFSEETIIHVYQNKIKHYLNN